MREPHPLSHRTMRIPAEIAEVLRRLAKQHDRSLNGESVRALRADAEKHTREPEPC
jgi:Arc-like DNA binding domain